MNNPLDKLNTWLAENGITVCGDAQRADLTNEHGFDHFKVHGRGPVDEVDSLMSWAIAEFTEQLHGHKNIWWRAVPRITTDTDFEDNKTYCYIYFRGCSW
jgi:hypothetical protein